VLVNVVAVATAFFCRARTGIICDIRHVQQTVAYSVELKALLRASGVTPNKNAAEWNGFKKTKSGLDKVILHV